MHEMMLFALLAVFALSFFFLFARQRKSDSLNLQQQEESQGADEKDYDFMTGLLYRDAGEVRIKELMAARTEPGGILLKIEMDDLKDIIDVMGPAHGKQSIANMADVLKEHFRKDDILVYLEDGKFMVYLPKAAKNVPAVELTLSMMMRRLSTVLVEDSDDWFLRCSIGCGIEIPESDTLEELVRRADLALHHVKHSGKNSFVFYEPDMEQEEYRFRSKRLLTMPSTQKFAVDQIRCLLGSIASFYQLVLSVNVERNSYYLMEECDDGVFASTPSAGILDTFVNLAAQAVHPDDKEEYLKLLSREGLLQACEDGKEHVHHHFRFYNGGTYRWIECIVIFYLDVQGEFCDFTLLRWEDERGAELERQFFEVSQKITARKEELNQLTEQISVEDMVLRCMHILSRDGDLHTALMEMLRQIGEHYQGDRVYIMEYDFTRDTMDNTFEWCAAGVRPQMEHTKNLPLDLANHWNERFESVGEFAVLSIDEDAGLLGEGYRILREQGVQSLLAAPLKYEDQVVGFVGVDNPRNRPHELTLLRSIAGLIREALNKQRLVVEVEHLSYADVLTGVGNRSMYIQLLKTLETNPPDTLGLIILDINGLGGINETYGLVYGDQILKRAAEILHRQFPKNVYRTGGDEFVAVCCDMSREVFQTQVVDLRSAFRKEKNYDVAIGIAWSEEKDSMNINGLRQQAQEMRRADKQSYYHNILQDGGSVSHAGFAGEVLKEIEAGRFTVYYQPQVDLKTGQVVGAEALVRKIAEDGSLVPPGQFIPFYEVGGVISHVDLFVLKTSCAALKKWRAQGHELRISVNFSRITLLEPYIVEVISNICAEHGVPASAIAIEVTESIGKMDTEQLHELIEKLKAAGFGISLDDFGSEYSNLAILASMDFDEIKFDRSLVKTLEENHKSRLVVECSLRMCSAMEGTVSLAEGIETRGQLELLADYQCNYGQGYYFSRPLPMEQFEDFMLRFCYGKVV